MFIKNSGEPGRKNVVRGCKGARQETSLCTRRLAERSKPPSKEACLGSLRIATNQKQRDGGKGRK